MEKSPNSMKQKKLEWDGRFAHDGATKQELPLPPRLKTMNGCAIKSTFQHLGIQARKGPAMRTIMSSPSSISLRERERISAQESKRGGALVRIPVTPSSAISVQYETPTPQFMSSASSCTSLLTLPSDIAGEKTRGNPSTDYKCSKSQKGKEEHDRGLSGNVFRSDAVPKTRLFSLEIDVSGSLPTIDKEDYEMRKEIFDMANLSPSQSDSKLPGLIPNSYRNQNILSLSGTLTLPNPLCRLEVIGRGSSATIYKAVILKALTLCAEKVIAVSDASKRVQMMSELQSLKKTVRDRNGRSRCENIISLLDIVANPKDGTISICLEYMSGGSLQDIVRMGGCNNDYAVQNIARQMLLGVHFLHSLRLLHRDIKPSNALISLTGVVKLADFGLAKTLEYGASLAESFCGTLDFIAPERITGNTYSFASDIWSCGLSIHTVAIGRYPYNVEKGGFWSILNAIQNMSVPLPNDSFPPSFTDFIYRACLKNPMERDTASQLLTHPFITSNLTAREYSNDNENDQNANGNKHSAIFNKNGCIKNGSADKNDMRNSNEENNVGDKNSMTLIDDEISVSNLSTETRRNSPDLNDYNIDNNLNSSFRSSSATTQCSTKNSDSIDNFDIIHSSNKSQSNDTYTNNKNSSNNSVGGKIRLKGIPTFIPVKLFNAPLSSQTSKFNYENKKLNSCHSSILSTLRKIESKTDFRNDISNTKISVKNSSPYHLRNMIDENRNLSNANLMTNSYKLNSRERGTEKGREEGREKRGSDSRESSVEKIRGASLVCHASSDSLNSRGRERSREPVRERRSEKVTSVRGIRSGTGSLSRERRSERGTSMGREKISEKNGEKGKGKEWRREKNRGKEREGGRLQSVSSHENSRIKKPYNLTKIGESGESRDSTQILPKGLQFDSSQTISEIQNRLLHELEICESLGNGNSMDGNESRHQSSKLTEKSANNIASAWKDYITMVAIIEAKKTDCRIKKLEEKKESQHENDDDNNNVSNNNDNNNDNDFDSGDSDDGETIETNDIDDDLNDTSISSREDKFDQQNNQEKSDKILSSDRKRKKRKKGAIHAISPISLSVIEITKLAKQMVFYPKSEIVSVLGLNYHRNESNTENPNEDKNSIELSSNINTEREIDRNQSLLRGAFLNAVSGMKASVSSAVEKSSAAYSVSHGRPGLFEIGDTDDKRTLGTVRASVTRTAACSGMHSMDMDEQRLSPYDNSDEYDDDYEVQENSRAIIDSSVVKEEAFLGKEEEMEKKSSTSFLSGDCCDSDLPERNSNKITNENKEYINEDLRDGSGDEYNSDFEDEKSV